MTLEESINLCLENFSEFGLGDITVDDLEKDILKNNKTEIASEIKRRIGKGSIYEMDFRPIKYILTPKTRYIFDYRKASIIDPMSLIMYTSLVFQMAETIESKRIPISEQRVFSYRWEPNSPSVFNRSIGYDLWREKCKEQIQLDSCRYIVKCDIASFYDRINLHRLESTLSSIGVEKALFSKINDILTFWSKKDSYGIPVGGVASRILAEAVLIDIDEYLVDEGINFIRYVDDFRIFCPTLVDAHVGITKIMQRLFRDGLMLNAGKTDLSVAIKDKEKEKEKDETEGDDGKEASEVLKTITRLAGGYSRIVKTFIMPASDKYEPFLKIDIEKEIDTIRKAEIVDFSTIQKIVISSIVQKKYNYLSELTANINQYVYAIDYFIDMLIKNKDYIPKKNRIEIKDSFILFIKNNSIAGFDWYEAKIAKILGFDEYFDKKTLLSIVKRTNKESTAYPSCIALESLAKHITRTDFRTLREWFDRCDDWEKRRIINLCVALPEEEKKAWIKAVKSTVSHDYFSKLLIEKC